MDEDKSCGEIQLLFSSLEARNSKSQLKLEWSESVLRGGEEN
jgi:hypothetical protein